MRFLIVFLLVAQTGFAAQEDCKNKCYWVTGATSCLEACRGANTAERIEKLLEAKAGTSGKDVK